MADMRMEVRLEPEAAIGDVRPTDLYLEVQGPSWRKDQQPIFLINEQKYTSKRGRPTSGQRLQD